MAFATSRFARVGAAILLSLGMTVGLASTTVLAAGPATQYIVTSTSYSPVAGTGVTISAQLADSGNASVSTGGITVTWSKTGSGGSFSSPTSVTNGSGLATVTFTTGTTAGTVYTVTATDVTPLTGTSSNITTVAGNASKYLVTSSSYGPVAGTGVTISAQLADTYGNPVTTSGISVTWGKTGSGGSFGSPTSLTNGSGIATVTFTTGTTAGTVYTVTATDVTPLTGTSSNITTVAGNATQVFVETASNGTGSVVLSQNLLSGSSITVYAISRDQYGNFVGNPSATWSLTGISGNVVNGDLVGSGASAVFTGHGVGSAVIQAQASFTGSSGTITVTASQVRVETASNGTGSVVSAQSLASGSSITVYAISRDVNGTFVANVSATWSLTGITGGVVSGDLVGYGTSAVFTGHLAGSATIHATWDGATAVNSGLITVIGGTVNQALSTVVASPTSVPANGSTTSTITVTLKDAYSNPVSGKAVSLALSSGPGSPSILTTLGTSNASGVATFTVSSTTAGTDYFQATDATDALVITQTPSVTFTAAQLVVSAPSSAAAGSAFNVTVTAEDLAGNTVTSYSGTVQITSTGPGTMPANHTLTSGVGTFSVILSTAGTWYVTAMDTVTTSLTDTSGPIVVTTASTYFPLSTPARVVDTRLGLGISTKLTANVPASFQVWGDGYVPSGASAVTGNVTVVNETSSWAVYLGPIYQAYPTTSNINFTAGQIIGNSLTVPLTATGGLYATYMSNAGNTTDLVFDVTGYYMPNTSGATYHPLTTPYRVLDTRYGTGLSAKLGANTPVSFQVSGSIVPSNATAVTGNVTVVNDTNAWAIYVGPVSEQYPTTSTVNFTTGQITGNGMTVALSQLGTLYATYMSTAGNTTDLVFDVTGYYTNDATGAEYMPVTPTRLLDTRYDTGLAGPLYANTPATLQVTGSVVPSGAVAVTGNVTVVDETAGWAVYLGPVAQSYPTTSNINFLVGDIKGNGTTVGLASGGILYPTYMSNAGNTTDLVFDVTGYFLP
ncbi:MAG: invasin domain 3-containing protein [Candidatus Limnocylindrales bacterium]|jgi:hypothetical protein